MNANSDASRLAVPLALGAGTLFGAGLALSGMTDTHKVVGFLNLFGTWDPTLLIVMASALAVTMIGFPAVLKKRTAPVCDNKFHLPATSAITPKLLGGAALFGIGWGIYGYCPGPAISSLVYLQAGAWVFVAAMVVGFWGGTRLGG